MCRVKIKSCIFSGHDDSVKVGVNQKKILVKKPLLMCYVLIKGLSKYAKGNKTLKLRFCEKTSSVINAISDNRCG